MALNKKTGELIWKCAVPGGEQAVYTSALMIEAGGVRQYVQMLQKGLVGVEAKTVKLLWRYDRTAKGSPAVIPTPVAAGDFIYTSPLTRRIAVRRRLGPIRSSPTAGSISAISGRFAATMSKRVDE
jgi:hypothetical protein